MREIKFRAWDGEGMIYHYDGFDEMFDVFSIGDYCQTVGKILMQYTGLKDKNGREIYEGDIVKVPDNYEEYGFMAGEIREIYFLDGCFRLKPKEVNGRGHTIEDDMNMCEIIGNIYENPELLKEK